MANNIGLRHYRSFQDQEVFDQMFTYYREQYYSYQQNGLEEWIIFDNLEDIQAEIELRNFYRFVPRELINDFSRDMETASTEEEKSELLVRQRTAIREIEFRTRLRYVVTQGWFDQVFNEWGYDV